MSSGRLFNTDIEMHANWNARGAETAKAAKARSPSVDRRITDTIRCFRSDRLIRRSSYSFIVKLLLWALCHSEAFSYWNLQSLWTANVSLQSSRQSSASIWHVSHTTSTHATNRQQVSANLKLWRLKTGRNSKHEETNLTISEFCQKLGL